MLRISQNPGKRNFFKKIVKNCFGGTFDHFLGKEGVLSQKLV